MKAALLEPIVNACQVIISCEICGTCLPVLNDDSKHNFCPAILDGEIINVCIKCKMREIEHRWAGTFDFGH